jgi:signal transduction histidine kinase
VKPSDDSGVNIGKRLKLTLALLIALILGGNSLVIFQFEKARLETARVTVVSQQLIGILRLQQGLLSFHQRLNDLSQTKDARRMVTDAKLLQAALLQQTQEARKAFTSVPSDFRADPEFLIALDTIEMTLPSQLGDINDLATAGDWEGVHLRLNTDLQRIESTTSALVSSIESNINEELPRAVANMRELQRGALIMVPATAISTGFVAALFGWAIARRLLELRLEERVRERTRIARDLHDTLLQSFQGLLLRLQVVNDMLAPGKAQEELERTLERAEQAIIEGRSAVHDLRSSTADTKDLSEAVRDLGNELAGGHAASFHVVVEGLAQDLHPIIRDEFFWIAREALRNTFKHAQARHVEVEITYSPRLLRLRIRDDGKGIDPAILEAGRSGHYGLPGMRERATQIGAKLHIWSGVGAGTEVDLTIAGPVAYLARQRSRLWLFRRERVNL